jgi:c-di-GMP-binding flagellar brake protein YcgR
MSSERRQFKRIPIGATVAFQELSFQAEPVASQSLYRDVSGGGLLLSSPREVPLGTLLKLELRVPGLSKHQVHIGPTVDSGPRPIVAVGEVVRLESMDSGQYELGIKFLNIYPDDWAALLKFIEASVPADTN